MNPYLIPALAMSPTVFERIYGLMDPEHLDQPSEPGRFTPREVFAHLADWEPILCQRMRQTVERPGSKLIVYDEGQRAFDNSYNKSDVEVQLKLFSERRKETLEFLALRSEPDWDKTAIHPERGPLTLRDQANMLPGHEMYHIEQLLGVIARIS